MASRDDLARRWHYVTVPSEFPPPLVQLAGGDWMISPMEVFGRFDDLDLELTLVAEDGRAVLRSVKIARDRGDVTPSEVHSLPLGALVSETLERAAPGTLALVRALEARNAGREHRFLTPDERAAEVAKARISQRGRPVAEATLRAIAGRVREMGYVDREALRSEFPASPRTISRWIAEARSRGYLSKEVDGE